MRSGDAYVASLRDGRAVFLDGARVGDVTAHPGFAEPIRRIAEGYDRARAAPEIATCLDPDTGERIGAMWLKPRTAADLAVRQAVHRFWAEGSYGLMGRTPDHVACVLTAFAAARDFFAQGGGQFGGQRRAFPRAGPPRRSLRLLCHRAAPGGPDAARPSVPEPFLHPGVVKERDGGIVLRGCQAIATSAVLSDWLFLSYITPLAPGDEDYAISVVMPIPATSTRG